MKRESSTIAAWRTNLALRWRYLLALSITMLPFACASAAGWDYHTGKGYTLCDALHKRLNQYSYPNPKRPNSCAWNVALTYPEFKEPDWTELDPKQHSELAYRLIRYGQSSGSKVFSAYRESLIRDEVQKFIERGGRVQLWRTDLISESLAAKVRPFGRRAPLISITRRAGSDISSVLISSVASRAGRIALRETSYCFAADVLILIVISGVVSERTSCDCAKAPGAPSMQPSVEQNSIPVKVKFFSDFLNTAQAQINMVRSRHENFGIHNKQRSVLAAGTGTAPGRLNK